MDVRPYDPRLNNIAKLCVNRIEDLFEKLDVHLTVSGNKYIGDCPIHGDSNSGSFNLYYDGYSVPGYWKCRSKGCHEKFRHTIIGFVRGRLSNLELGYHWADRPSAIYPFPKTINFLCNFLGVKLNNIKVDPREAEKLRFIAECTASMSDDSQKHMGITRNQVRSNLIFPAKYFLQRGYSESVLDRFDVGIAKRSKRETQDRVIVPIYNDSDYLVGYTCRSIFDQCPICKLFHDPKGDCPTDEFEKNLACKWRHMNFNSEKVLYNFYSAKADIIKTNTVVLVEGPGDVWRLAEANINNAVALFGNNLSEAQERLLASAQTMTIIGLLDNDIAGRDGMKRMKEKYGRLFRMYFPNFSGEAKDVGEINSDTVTNNIKPLIDKIMGIYNA